MNFGLFVVRMLYICFILIFIYLFLKFILLIYLFIVFFVFCTAGLFHFFIL